MLEKFKKMVRHNKGQAAALVIIALLSLWMFGCDSKVKSLRDAGVKVTRGELQIEKDGIVASITAEIGRLEATVIATRDGYQLRVGQLDRLDAAKAKIADVGMIVASGGTVNPVGALASLLALLGVGAIVDNQKKDGIIIDIKKNS